VASTGERWTIARAATAEDLASVEALQKTAFTNPWGADAIKWELENTDVARLYVMREADTVVAFCACWVVFDELHINSFAVAPDWRRRGLATRLLQEVFRDARADGATAATLEVRSSNVAARALYEKLGFVVEGVRRDYYQAPREDALILWNRRLAVLAAPPRAG
jgi:ribosomal-protein-alanine N-acetyltransferase